MDGLLIGIDPVVFRYGSIAVRWYGVAIALGIALGVFVALREARRLALDEDAVYNTALWGVVGGLIGARIFHVVDRLDFYLQNPSTVMALQQGGLSVWGGVVGGVLAGAAYARWAKLPLARVADVAAPGLLIGQIVGRLGSLVNGDAYGSPADLPWSITYIHADALIPDLGEPTHPYPLYEMAWNLAVLGVIWRLRRDERPDGTTFLAYIVLYSAGRFLLTFVRQETIGLLGLQQAQLIALVAAVAAAFPLRRCLTR